jgi:hypothetical protein
MDNLGFRLSEKLADFAGFMVHLDMRNIALVAAARHPWYTACMRASKAVRGCIRLAVVGVSMIATASCADLAFFVVSAQISSNDSIPPEEKGRLEDEVGRQLALADQLDGHTEYRRWDPIPADDPALVTIDSRWERGVAERWGEETPTLRDVVGEREVAVDVPFRWTRQSEVDRSVTEWLAGLDGFRQTGFRIDRAGDGRYGMARIDGPGEAALPFELIATGPYPGVVRLRVLYQLPISATDDERRRSEERATSYLSLLRDSYQRSILSE